MLASGCVSITDPNDPVLTRGVLSPVRAGQPNVFRQISASNRHTCAIDTGGAAWCWGANDTRQLGTDAVLPVCQIFPCTSTARQTGGNLRFTKIIAGNIDTCGLGVDGKAYCWGETYRWLDTLVRTTTPVVVPSDSLFASIAGGGAHYCGLTAGGS